MTRFQQMLEPHLPSILQELENHTTITLTDLIPVLKGNDICSDLENVEYLYGLRGLVEGGLLPKEKIARPTLPSNFNKEQEVILKEIIAEAIQNDIRYSITELAEQCHSKCPGQTVQAFESKIRFLLVPFSISGADDETSGFP